MINPKLFIPVGEDAPMGGLKPQFRRPLLIEYLRWVQMDLADRLRHPRARLENETLAAYEMNLESDLHDTEQLLRLVSWELRRHGIANVQGVEWNQ